MNTNHRARWAVACLILLLVTGCGGGDSTPEQTAQPQTIDDHTTYVATEPEAISRSQDAWLSTPDDENDPMYHFKKAVREAGGMSAFAALIASPDQTALRAVLQKNGVRYSDNRETASSAERQKYNDPLDVSVCVRNYEPENSNRLFMFGVHSVYIDTVGRPGYATWMSWPGAPTQSLPRSPCQTTVGTWGLPGDQGGHLIPTVMGGWGGRANLFPQNGTLNMGAWRQVEQIPQSCVRFYQTQYFVQLFYPTILDVRPYRIGASVVILHPMSPIPLGVGSINTPNEAPSAQTYTAISDFQRRASLFCV